MSFLLKIVQGPNAGAEVALVEGTTLSFGTSTDCDIVLTDAALAPQAFELEVSQERVVVVFNGKTVKLDPFHVSTFGTTALVIGPAEGAWKTLIWPAPTTVVVDEAREEEAPTMVSSLETPQQSRERSSKKGWAFLLFLFLIGIGLGFAFWKYPERSKAIAQRSWTWVKTTTTSFFKDETPAVASNAVATTATTDTLASVAKKYGFTLSYVDGKAFAKGDFATRSERLTATAQAYATRPGIRLDFADDESLKVAMDQHLELITEGALTATKVNGRKAFLAGQVESQETLEKILLSIRSDLPKIAAIDCSQVVITPPTTVGEKIARRVTKRKTTSHATSTKMPIVGILTVPYPCLVLSDGTRAMEGARFGDYTIEKIAADHVVLTSPQGSFTWRP